MRLSIAMTVLLAAGTAAAQTPSTPPPAIDYELTSYRTTTLIVDGTSLSLLLASFFLEKDGGGDTNASLSTFYLGAIGVLFVTPGVHIGRGHGARGVGSFFMRIGLGTLGALAGIGLYDGGGEYGFVAGAGFGAVGGFAIAAGLDAAFLTSERTPRSRWTPAVTATRGGVRLVLGTTF